VKILTLIVNPKDQLCIRPLQAAGIMMDLYGLIDLRGWSGELKEKPGGWFISAPGQKAGC
jgi:hypothetical protein